LSSSCGPAPGTLEADSQGEAERGGETFQQRQRRGRAPGLEPRDAGLAHPRPLGELALRPTDVPDPARFADRDHFAAYNGTAPVQASPGNRNLFRLSRRAATGG
jgi:hypothetical protein